MLFLFAHFDELGFDQLRFLDLLGCFWFEIRSVLIQGVAMRFVLGILAFSLLSLFVDLLVYKVVQALA